METINEYWMLELREKGWIIKPRKRFYCPICGDDLLLHDFASYHATGDFYHVDVHMKCPSCSFYATFGVPCHRKHHEKLVNSYYAHRVLRGELLEIESLDERILKRLREWGYW